MIETEKSRVHLFFFLAITALGFFLRPAHLAEPSLWRDEFILLCAARLDYSRSAGLFTADHAAFLKAHPGALPVLFLPGAEGASGFAPLTLRSQRVDAAPSGNAGAPPVLLLSPEPVAFRQDLKDRC